MSVATSPILPPPSAKGSNKELAFAFVAVVLVAAAVLLNTLVPSLKISFRKEAVEPAEPLKMIGQDLGPWAQINVDRAFDADMEHELGANQYVSRVYVDTRLIPAKLAASLKGATTEQREKLVEGAADVPPNAIVRLNLTYYTGSDDTVPHVPDRCYIADGFKPSEGGYQVVTWPVLPRKNEADRNVGVRLINFEDQVDSRHARPCQVAYFFQVNGYYENDPIFGVRKRLQNLFDRSAYFAKIELRTDLPNPQDANTVLTDFLQHAMPDIERVLPHQLKTTN